MSNLRRNLRQAIEATGIHGSTEYSWFGKRSGPAPLALRRWLSRETARTYLRAVLQGQLYRDFYCRGVAHPAPLQDYLLSDLLGNAEFTVELSKANCGHGSWEPGWTALRIEGSTVAVSKAGLTLSVTRDQVQLSGDPPLSPGSELAIRLPKELLGLSPGFYVATGDVPLEEHDQGGLLRFYWNLQPEGAPALVAVATRALNQASLPFTLKVINERTHFFRCDAAVLCVPKRCYTAAVSIVADAYSAIRVHMKPLTPVFTKELAPGLGFAENPPGGESFGLHRCRLLAHGIIESQEQGKRTVNAILESVETSFAAEGIDLDSPYLNPGSIDEYPEAIPLRCSVSSALGNRIAVRHEPLETAAEIGRQILSEAIWHGGRCNWLGRTILEAPGEPASAAVQGMLDSSLYSGTSGVALFLAELHQRTGDVATRKTALAGIDQALDSIEADGDPGAIGLYTGWPGIAVVAARTGLVLKEDRLVHRAKLLIDRCKTADHNGEFDLLSGRAGAIIGLIVLSDLLGDRSLLNLAETIGRYLTTSAETTDVGVSWKSPAFPDTRNLTGFSHGTAGVALALLELFSMTGDPEFRRCAEEAFKYEQSWFDSKAKNWCDLRQARERPSRRPRRRNYATSWCHGAPGIALSRLRAHEITGSESARVEAIVAASTTRSWVEVSLASGSENFSLCHGMAGNAEVLRDGFRVIGAEAALEGQAAERVADYGMRTYRRAQGGWPCGSLRSTPSLMLGLAGIGYFYLSIGGDSPPSVLLLRREEWRRTSPPAMSIAPVSRASEPLDA